MILRIFDLRNLYNMPLVLASGTKPLESSPCVVQECAEQFEYRVVGMTPCSRSCLGGKWLPLRFSKTPLRHTVVKCLLISQVNRVKSSSLEQNIGLNNCNKTFILLFFV